METPFLKSLSIVGSGSYNLAYNNTIGLNQPQIGSGTLHSQNRDVPLQQAGIRNARGLTDSDAPKKSLSGSLAEVTVALAFNQPFRLNFDSQLPADFYIQGHPVDVKCSTHPNLLIAARHLKKDTIYFAVQQLSESEYRLIGYIHGRDVEEKYKCNPGGRGPAYIIPWSDLKPFRILCGSILN